MPQRAWGIYCSSLQAPAAVMPCMHCVTSGGNFPCLQAVGRGSLMVPHCSAPCLVCQLVQGTWQRCSIALC